MTGKVQLASGLSGLASAAVSVTKVVPIGKKLPEAGLAVTSGEAVQLSLAAGKLKLTVAPHWPGSDAKVRANGQDMPGASVSSTVTVNVQVKPDAALTVTVVAPTGKKEPEAGVLVMVPQPGGAEIAG